MKKYIFIIPIFAWIGCMLLSCNSKENIMPSEDLSVLKVKLEDELLLSKIADTVICIPLSNDTVIKDISKLLLDEEDNMYILDSNGNGIFKFDKQGKYQGQISKKGNGPGEYIKIKDFDISDGEIVINNDFYQLLYYSLDGKFLSEKMREPTFLFACAGDTFCESNGYRSLYIWVKDDEKFSIKRAYSDNSLLCSHAFHFAKNRNEIYWEDCYNDTIFKITKGELQPFLYVDFGDMKLPKDIPMDASIVYNTAVQRYCSDISNFKISDNYLSFCFAHAKYFYTCIVDRKSFVPYNFKIFRNDINYLPLSNMVYAIKGKNIYTVRNADEVYSYYNLLKNHSEKEYRDKADELKKQIGKEIDEMDNAYIIIIKGK